jgi:hypothetical protein
MAFRDFCLGLIDILFRKINSLSLTRKSIPNTIIYSIKEYPNIPTTNIVVIKILDTKSMSESMSEDQKEIIEVGSSTFEVAYYETGNRVGRGGNSVCYEVRKYLGYTAEFLGE